MTSEPRAEITTILFTDLVSSTDLVQRIGDDAAQRIFEAHHGLLGDLLASHGGEELQWLGDGMMAAFRSTADAVRCAIAMQRAALRAGADARLATRIGLNVGEILRQQTGSGYFGTPVIVARRLCDRAERGEILCTSTVAGLLAGRKAFRFDDIGTLELKGIEAPVAVCRVRYQAERAAPARERPPFVGRGAELTRLSRRLERAAAGAGGLALVVGEPGIGKTRLTEEFAAQARRGGARVFWGRCFEGDWAPLYAPFSEALAEYAKQADLEGLRKEIGRYGGVLAALAPQLRDRLPDLPQPEPLQPDEERHRLFDAVARLLEAIAENALTTLVLDDLHWADGGTLAMLRYVARFAPRGRLLLVGAYRDVELDRKHPLADALAALRREPGYERILLKGLAGDELSDLVAAVAAHDVPQALVSAIDQETDGNPFFINEIVLHLAEEGRLEQAQGRSTSDLAIEELGIPEGVRQVIGQRLSRLSEEANRLLAAASGFGGAFHFEVTWRAAELAELSALDALDEALEAQLLRPTGEADVYDFGHALIRHTLYAELNPSRQVRLHRRIAEQMERVWAEHVGEHGAEIAQQYRLSAALPGAERGVVHCLAAVERAERAAAHEEATTFLRMALDLLPGADPREPRILARLGLALAWSMNLEEAVRVASEAGERIAASEGDDAAADYLADASEAVWGASFNPLAWRLAEQGLRYVGKRRDFTWFRLCGLDLTRREAEDPDAPGIQLDAPERRELAEVMERDLEVQEAADRGYTLTVGSVSSREELRTRFASAHGWRAFSAGEYRQFRQRYADDADAALAKGQLALAAFSYTLSARLEGALGNLEASKRSYALACELAERLPPLPFLATQMSVVPMEHGMVLGKFRRDSRAPVEQALYEARLENRWVLGVWRAIAADLSARAGREAEALRWLELALPAIERGPAWAVNYPALVCLAANTLWLLERCDHIEIIERNLREKVITPDFRYPHFDGRLALAKLLALQGRLDEAHEWFAKARRVLDEEGARPLRAVVDFEEALAHVRRDAPGDRECARALLGSALERFEPLGMTGWASRARSLMQQCEEMAP